jgi:hypothetical protein
MRLIAAAAALVASVASDSSASRGIASVPLVM